MGRCAQIAGTRKRKIPLLFWEFGRRQFETAVISISAFRLSPPNLLPKLTTILGIGNFDFPKKWPLFGQSESSSFFLSMWSTTRQICDGPSILPVSMLVYEYCNLAEIEISAYTLWNPSLHESLGGGKTNAMFDLPVPTSPVSG